MFGRRWPFANALGWVVLEVHGVAIVPLVALAGICAVPVSTHGSAIVFVLLLDLPTTRVLPTGQ